jgi:hypothetical protein
LNFSLPRFLQVFRPTERKLPGNDDLLLDEPTVKLPCGPFDTDLLAQISDMRIRI